MINFEQAVVGADREMQNFIRLFGKIKEKNTIKILNAFREERIALNHFNTSSGYGYNDDGRDKLEAVYARVFQGEDALVRQQILSGTHAIALALAGNLLPGDELLYVGQPYDTLQQVIGTTGGNIQGSLIEYGVKYRYIDIDFNNIDLQCIVDSISPQTKILALQRSKGYQWRNSLSIDTIQTIIAAVKAQYPHLIVFVDNCYGELVEDREPLEVGADMTAGSLIKNLGGGIAPCGGYIVGRADLIERASYRLSVPGAGKEVGASLGNPRLFYQGLFCAPQIVAEALAGAVFSAALFSSLGLTITPVVGETRADIIQGIQFNTAEKVIAFCQGIQKYSPVDAFAQPEPWAMPGYSHPVIMAAGAFIQGSSIELSADAPIREPYNVFMQGGLNCYHVKYAVIHTIQDMMDKGLI